MPKEITPATVEQATELAADIKAALTKMEAAIAQLPASPETDQVRRTSLVFHNKLNAAAIAAADLFGTDVATMSGGGDKPPQQP